MYIISNNIMLCMYNEKSHIIVLISESSPMNHIVFLSCSIQCGYYIGVNFTADIIWFMTG